MFGWMLVKMTLGKMMMQKFNEFLEKMRDFIMMNRLQISWVILGIFVFASIQSLLAGNFINSALFLLAAMMVVF